MSDKKTGKGLVLGCIGIAATILALPILDALVQKDEGDNNNKQ